MKAAAPGPSRYAALESRITRNYLWRGMKHISELTMKIKEFKRSFADLMDGIENLAKSCEISVSEQNTPLGSRQKSTGATVTVQDSGVFDNCEPPTEEDIEIMLKNLEYFYHMPE